MKKVLIVEWPDKSTCGQSLHLTASGEEFVFAEVWDDGLPMVMRTHEATPAELAEGLGLSEEILRRAAGRIMPSDVDAMTDVWSVGKREEEAKVLRNAANRIGEASR